MPIIESDLSINKLSVFFFLDIRNEEPITFYILFGVTKIDSLPRNISDSIDKVQKLGYFFPVTLNRVTNKDAIISLTSHLANRKVGRIRMQESSKVEREDQRRKVIPTPPEQRIVARTQIEPWTKIL
ncbi:14357_t:CDS:2 [Cetraspora pellucida]|uniref:14357_t:CDS:1 n=1 Tax=Cetraspora pellucida TaxID=1433469 RepID=A0ACA9K2V7_9GLOM|nr:14357_t:CDS:2 [Cetraspora pellucida]